MITVEFDCDFRKVAELCQRHIGPRKYSLHNRIGGDDWEVIENYRLFNSGRGGCTQVKIKDPKMATFLKLKLK